MNDVFTELKKAFPSRRKEETTREGDLSELHTRMSRRAVRITAKAFRISAFLIVSSNRGRDVVEARDAAILIIKEYIPISNREIGKIVGGRAASSVCYSLKRSRERGEGEWHGKVKIARRAIIRRP